MCIRDSVYSAAGMIILNHAKYFLEIRILAGIGFYAFLSSLLNPVSYTHLLVGVIISAIMRISVVFPAPFAPKSPQTPGVNVRLTSVSYTHLTRE